MATSSKESSSRKRKSSDSNGIQKAKTNGTDSDRKKILDMEKEERARLVLWRKPFTTLKYFSIEAFHLLKDLMLRMWQHKKLMALFVFLMIVCTVIYHIEGPHQAMVSEIEKTVWRALYWIGLGVLSSVGLGTGLHTFVLYLGPFIASVTLAAYECNTINFPEPPYPNQILCPTEVGLGVTIWTIMSKVRFEAVMWGVGTAIGELPPYFMARAARQSGVTPDDEDFEELEELIHEKKDHPQDLGLIERAKLYVHNLVQRVGFFGILACASIPNPLFDLAGITCGHFLIPFWTFFGATLIGKAIIKMHLQKLFVIFLFSAHHVESVIQLMGAIPYVGSSIQTPFREWLAKQEQKLHNPQAVESGDSLLSWVFEKLILLMVAYFILSIINSMAQSYHKRFCRVKRSLEKAGVANYTRVIKSNRD